MAESILKSFLIRLGFKVDQGQERNFQESLEKTSAKAAELAKGFVKVGAAAITAGTALGLTMAKVGQHLEGVYFQSRRVGASAKELDVLSYAAERVGVSADEARSAVESLAQARRMNPGLNGLIPGLDKTDNAKALLQLVGKLRGTPHYQAAQIAGMFGIDEQILYQLEQNGPEFLAAMKQREAQIAKEGINKDAQAKTSHEFMNHWAAMSASVKDLDDTVQTHLMPTADKVIDKVKNVTENITAADKATKGWSTDILYLAGSLGALKGVLGIFSMFGGAKAGGGIGLLGRGGAAAAGEAAAGEAAGGIGLGAIALPAVVVTALGALVWLVAHPDELKDQVEQAHQIGDKLRAGAKSSWDWTKDKAAAFGKGFMGDLASMTAKFEGFRNHVYKDIAGNATFGFGHLVKPGENMAGADPISLFMSDLKEALATVGRYVKVKLSGNQLKALADLEFNIGAKNFRDSTLLRLLNRGDHAGAADQFAAWNKVLVNGHKVANATLSQRRAAEAQMFRTPDGKSLTLNTKITIEDSGNARATARETANEQNRVYGNIVRNFTPAYQ